MRSAISGYGGSIRRGCILTNSGNFSVNNDTNTVHTMDTELLDTDGFASGGTGVITIPTGMGGVYDIKANVVFAANATGQRIIFIRKGGTTIVQAATEAPGTKDAGLSISVQLALVATDAIDLIVYQNSGGALNSQGNSLFPQLSVMFISP